MLPAVARSRDGGRLEEGVNLAPAAGLIGAGLALLLLLVLGLGWGPASGAPSPERLALLGLAGAGLLWPIVLIGLVGQRRAAERGERLAEPASPARD